MGHLYHDRGSTAKGRTHHRNCGLEKVVVHYVMDVLLNAVSPHCTLADKFTAIGFYYRKSSRARLEMGWSVAAPPRERIPIYICKQ